MCINVAPQAAREADYRVTLADLKAFEARLVRSRDDRAHRDRLGLVLAGSPPLHEREGRHEHFPASRSKRVSSLAKDRRSPASHRHADIDYGPSTAFEAHKVSMPLNVFHIENAAHLTELPPSGFTVIVAPIDIVGGSEGRRASTR